MELQSQEQQRFQKREWTVQRYGTFMLVAFIAAGFLGLLGAGPLATTTSSSPHGMVTVEYDWALRAHAHNNMHVQIPPQAVEDDTVTLELTGSWVSGVDIEGISPKPVEQRAIPDGVAMTFIVDSSHETNVKLTFVARELFNQQAQLTVAGDTVSFNQFVLP